jgi:peroxidase
VGLPTYNETRVAYGLPAVTSFGQITSDPALQAQLQSIYGNVDSVELFVGGLAEDHARGASVGTTFQAIIANQFERIRDGDRLWYQNVFSGAQLRAIQNTTLADIIQANTNTTNLQNNVFFFRAGISGSVSTGAFQPGRGSFGQPGGSLSGLTVNLLNSADGSLVATSMTDARGNYNFSVTKAGQYTVQLVIPGRATQNARLAQTVSITRGDQFASGVNFVLSLPNLHDHGFGSGWNGWQGFDDSENSWWRMP